MPCCRAFDKYSLHGDAGKERQLEGKCGNVGVGTWVWEHRCGGVGMSPDMGNESVATPFQNHDFCSETTPAGFVRRNLARRTTIFAQLETRTLNHHLRSFITSLACSPTCALITCFHYPHSHQLSSSTLSSS